jgi:chemotaxis protein MotB
MLLVIFFVVLFSMELQKRVPTTAAHAEAKETASAAKPEHAALNISASVEKDLASTLNTEKSEPEVAIKRDANVVVLTFPERIIFDPGQAQVKSSAQATLDKVADFIKERAYLIVEVQGHTDNQPINTVRYPSNWELSVDRATQVARALIGMGVNPLQLSVKGFGEYHCLYPNDSDENRLKNRRVEIQLSILPNEVQAKTSL